LIAENDMEQNCLSPQMPAGNIPLAWRRLWARAMRRVHAGNPILRKQIAQTAARRRARLAATTSGGN
jgi:hypothetical protein